MTFRPFGYFPRSNSARTQSPVCVWVAPIKLTIVARLVRGRPLQFCVMNEKSRCSILGSSGIVGGPRGEELPSGLVGTARQIDDRTPPYPDRSL